MSFVICECPKIISVFERGVTYVINIKLPAVITSRGKLTTQNGDNDVFLRVKKLTVIMFKYLESLFFMVLFQCDNIILTKTRISFRPQIV